MVEISLQINDDSSLPIQECFHACVSGCGYKVSLVLRILVYMSYTYL